MVVSVVSCVGTLFLLEISTCGWLLPLVEVGCCLFCLDLVEVRWTLSKLGVQGWGHSIIRQTISKHSNQGRNWVILKGGRGHICNRRDEIIYVLSPSLKCVAPLFKYMSFDKVWNAYLVNCDVIRTTDKQTDQSTNWQTDTMSVHKEFTLPISLIDWTNDEIS